MDPLSITASVIAVLDLTAKVVSYLYTFKNASKDQKRYAVEASALFHLLTNLKIHIDEATPTDPWYANIRALGSENGPLSQYKDALERLADRIIPKDGGSKAAAPLLWPFSKSEVAEIFTVIERLKSLTSIALEMDHL